MRAGARRHRLTIQHQVPGVGFTDPTWGTYAELWGSLEPLRGSELIAAQQVQSAVTGKSVINYLQGITPAMRIVNGGRTYEILGVIDPEERHKELQLLIKEQVPT